VLDSKLLIFWGHNPVSTAFDAFHKTRPTKTFLRHPLK
jgi:hypothetical protein